MSGLERMIERIQHDAKIQSDDLIRTAQEEAKKTVEEAGETAKEWQLHAKQKLDRDIEDYRSRALSGRELQHRRALLEAKQEIIASVIDQVCERLRGAEDEAYFEMLAKMFKTYVHAEKGRMYLSESDLKRVPAGFEEKINASARALGGEINLMKTPGNIPDGFLLEYDGIEENCTFEALVDANRNLLGDRINTLLWRDADVG